ncbi:chemotaxis protein CheW [Piscinibacter gummiphilus]|uniref:chemotaxis protein CheW n=1 Tax=Piscinibacter gummiphilus TaxID=946333 RepID=UPI000A26A9E4|nr:chemotaxis protein CheW [Piscinibacter gummiphilus]ATU66534.1 chemotaxis protein CheW [Piscinibacter gummiphilus]GLS93901.1 chemotaxis protein CheW [Piscinibacter gummiphilus]
MSPAITLDDTPFEPSSGASSPATTAGTLANGSEFLTFKLGGEDYGLDLLRVQEIRSFEEPTRIANAPAGVLGVLDLRGVIVPVVDLRVHLGFPQAPRDGNTVVIVLAITGRVVGVVVDGVSDVIAIGPKQLRPAPEFNARLERRHVMAIGAVDRRMLILVDIDALLGEPSLGLLSV